MTKSTEKSSKPERSGVSTLVVVLALAVGFLSGVSFSIWKLKGVGGDPTSSTGSPKLGAMAEALESQLEKDPKNADLLARLGNTYFDTDQYEKAIDTYEKSLAIKPNNTEVLTDLGIMYRRVKQPEKSLASFDKAIAINPKHENAYINKGIVLVYDMGKREEAIATWETLRDINPMAMAGKQSIDELITHFKDGHDKENKK